MLKGLNLSDDKREKLREYLRNNRPKNSVNLGNSSDNKENSNKNLENDLNLNNIQISNTRGRNNLIIRDYIYTEYGYLSIFTVVPVLLFLFAVVSIYQGRFLYALISAMVSLPLLTLLMINRKTSAQTKKFLFELNSVCVRQIQNNKTIKQIKLKNIQKIRKSNDIRWDYNQKTNIFEIIIFLIWICLGTLIGEIYLGLMVIGLFIFIVIFTKLILHIKYGGFSSLMYFDQIVIYGTFGEIINIFVATEEEYKTLRVYFLDRLNLDIDKVPKVMSVFSKR